MIKERRSHADASPVDTIIFNSKTYTGSAVIQGFEEYFKVLAIPNPDYVYQSTITESVVELAEATSRLNHKGQFTGKDLDKSHRTS